jgi:hypothetical protein
MTLAEKHSPARENKTSALEQFNEALNKLVETVEIDSQSGDYPVLSCIFSEIETTSVLHRQIGVVYMSIIAHPPRASPSLFLPQLTTVSNGLSRLAPNYEVLWDVDEGRYVLIKNIRILARQDYVSTLNAIVSVSLDACEWFSQVIVPDKAA